MLVYLDLEKEPMFFFAVLLVIDYITGLYKAKTLGHSITSNKMKYGCISKLLLLLIPIVLVIIDIIDDYIDLVIDMLLLIFLTHGNLFEL